jgi:hypothetical protein
MTLLRQYAALDTSGISRLYAPLGDRFRTKRSGKETCGHLRAGKIAGVRGGKAIDRSTDNRL